MHFPPTSNIDYGGNEHSFIFMLSTTIYNVLENEVKNLSIGEHIMGDPW